MKGWTIAAVCAAGWVATALEARRRYVEDGKALEAAREGLSHAYSSIDVARDPTRPRDYTGELDRAEMRGRVVTAAMKVGAALEARQPLRGFRGGFA